MANYNIFIALSTSTTQIVRNLVVGDTITLSVRNNLPSNTFFVSSGAFSPASYTNNTGSTSVYAVYSAGVYTLNATTSTNYVINIYGYGGGFRSGRIVGSITQAAASYSLTAPSSIQEGTTGTIAVSASNHLAALAYWAVSPTADFSPSTGQIYIPTTGTTSFTLSPTADNSTEGNETGTIRLYSNSARTIQIASDTFTITDQAASGGGGASGGGTTGGNTSQGIEVFSTNGTKVFGTDLRTQNMQLEFSVTISGNSTTGLYSMPDANDSTKTTIALVGTYWNDPNRFTINTSSSGFTITNNSGSSQTANIIAFRTG